MRLTHCLAVLALGLVPAWGGLGQILIGEVDPFGQVEDLLGEEEDWIEVWNAGSEPASLSGLWLSDDPDEWDKWPLPAVTLGPEERLIVFASGRDVRTIDHWECPVRDIDLWRYHIPQGSLPSDWRRPEYDDSAWNTAPGGFGYGDGDDATDVAGANVVYLRRTFSLPDLPSLMHGFLALDYDDGCVAFINGHEVFRSGTMQDQSVAFDTWTNGLHEAELYQGGVPEHVSFDPREWLVEGDNVLAVQVHNESATSSDLTIRPFLAVGRGEAAVAPFNALPDWMEEEDPGFHTNFKLKPGEPLILSTASGALLDLATLPMEFRSGLTLGRQGSGPDDWCWFTTPTPGQPNDGDCLAGILPTPDVVPSSGHFPGPPAVTATPGAPSGPPGQSLPTVTLRYTTDGSEPTPNSPAFTGTWNPGETIALSVRAFAEGWVPSATVDRTFFIAEPPSPLERISILTHPDHLWDWETGIYVMGPNAGQDYPFMGANFWQPWSKESRLEWFQKVNEGGASITSARFDLEIHGGWSRAEPQRSFRLDFKPKWTGKLDHAVFPSKPGITAFGNLNLRNGGQASWENKIQDAFLSQLAIETHAVAGAWRPVEVYLNGEYWGLYGAREKTDEQFVEDNFGWKDHTVDLFNQWVTQNGSPAAWEATVNPLLGLPSGSDAFRDGFEANFDVLSYFDYHIFEIHGQNVDWMTAPWGLKNFKYFRSLAGDGKWRAILYDLDACFGAWGTGAWEDYLQLTINPPYPSSFSALFGKVLDHPELGCRFATRYCDLLATTFEPNQFNARFDEAAAWIGPAMERHIEMWNSPASVEYWQYRVDLMQENNAERILPSREHVRGHFGFAAPKTMTVEWASPIGGEVLVNDLSGLDNGWQGAYFGECPVRLAAVPAEGYGFLGWEENGHTLLGLLDPTVPFAEVELYGDDTFKALFGPCLSGVTVSIAETENGLEAVVEGGAQPLTFEWWLDGQPIGWGPNWTGEPVEGLVVTATNGDCTIFSAPFGSGPVVGVDEPVAITEAQSGLRILPNPARESVLVQGWGDRIEAINAWGALHHTQSVQGWPARLDVSAWPPGVYVIRTMGPQGVRSERLIVQ